MKTRLAFFVVLQLVTVVGLSAQQAQRWAIVAARSTASSQNPATAAEEDRVTDELTAQMTGTPGVVLVDRASIDKVIKEQNSQNSDRFAADTAVRIGKLLGVSQIVLVQVYDFSPGSHQEQSGTTTRVTGSMILRVNARMIDVETAVIRAQPSAVFEESFPISESSQSQGVTLPLGGLGRGLSIPPRKSQSGGDPNIIMNHEKDKATTAVVRELAAKLSGGVSGVAGPIAAAPGFQSALVAGITNGAVYINRGSIAGVVTGGRYQVTRDVSLGLNDPETNKPMTQKQRVCVLTISTATDTIASGTCDGGIPQPRDVVEPIR